MFETDFGYFSDTGDEYIVTRPDTPRPWSNILTNPRYGCILSQAGGGFSWIGSSKLSMLTRWNQEMVGDHDGLHIFITEPAADRHWSLSWNPCPDAGGEFSCTHGIGYSILSRTLHGIHARQTVFVPPDDTLEIRLVELRNETASPRTLHVQSALTWLCDAWYDAHREFHRTFLETDWRPESHAIFARKRRWDVPYIEGEFEHFTWPYTAFHAVSKSPSFASGDLEEIRGRNGRADSPAALRAPDGVGRFGRHVDSAASLRVLLTLPPGATRRVAFLLGADASEKNATRLISRYASVPAAQTALKTTRAWWRNLLGRVSVATPDARINTLVNHWLPYQAIAGGLFAKAGYFQNSGAFGFRDQLQDSQVWFLLDPPRAKEHIRRTCRVQNADGSVAHWWFPDTPIACRTNCSDDFLWLPFILCRYVNETGDTRILDAREPFADAGKDTVLRHALASIDRALDRLSPRGLPLIGDNDWNDGMSSVGDKMKGESVWLGHFLHGILLDMADLLAARRTLPRRAAKYRTAARALRAAINSHCWDGEWYTRATTDEGAILGAKACREGRIFLNAQTWAVIGRTADADRADTAMRSARALLYHPYGSLLFAPPYTTPDPAIGYLTQYAPGMRENGGVYTHAAVWSVLAEAMRGDAACALNRLRALCPVKPREDAENYATEPYVLPGNIDGPATPTPGRAGWTWYTGSAAWMYHTVIRWILGIRPTRDGIVIDPCIDPSWKTFSAKCTVGTAHLSITVTNRNGVERGVSAVTVNGEPASLPLTFPRDTHADIIVTMG